VPFRVRDNPDQCVFQERRARFVRFLRVMMDGVITRKMSHEDLDYYERRAEAEIEAAQQARHQAVVQAHYELASAYLDRIHGEAPRSSGGLLTP
jgi:beta-galactosidase GanA